MTGPPARLARLPDDVRLHLVEHYLFNFTEVYVRCRLMSEVVAERFDESTLFNRRRAPTCLACIVTDAALHPRQRKTF